MTLNKYNKLYQKIASRSHQNNFDEEYVYEDDKADIAVQALNRNKKINCNVFYTYTYGYKSNLSMNQMVGNYPQGTNYGENLIKSQKKTVYNYESQKQKIIFKEIVLDPSNKIKAPSSTRVVEYNLNSSQINNAQIQNLVANLDYFSHFNIKELILNLSSNPLCDNGFVELINILPKFMNIENIEINLEETQISDHSLRLFNQISSHLESLKEMKLILNKTQITEKQSYSLVDTFNSNGIDLEIECDFEQVNKYAVNAILNSRQNGELGGSNISNSSQGSSQSQNPNTIKSNNKLLIKLNEKKTIAAQNAIASSSNVLSSTDMNVQPFSSYFGNLAFQSQNLQQQQINSLLQQQNIYKPSAPTNFSSVPAMNQQPSLNQEEDIKRKSPEELATEKTYEDGYGKGFKILMGLGYKVGKGLGKNDQGITEPVQPQNKSKFKENNQSKSSIDYFESLSKQGQTQQGLQKMVKFEKKSTLIINQQGVQNQQYEGEEENNSSSPSDQNIESNEQQKDSSKSKGSTNNKQQNIMNENPSPLNLLQNIFGNPNVQQMHQTIQTTPFIGGINLLTSQPQQMQQQFQMPPQLQNFANIHPSRMI